MWRGCLCAVVVVLALTAGCSDEPADPQGVDTPSSVAPTASASGTSPTETPNGLPPDDTPPPPRPLEARVIESLDAVGVDGRVAQHGFRDAMIAGGWRERTVLVHAYPRDYVEAATPGKTIGRATISNIDVTFLSTKAFGTIGRLRCGGLVYDVSSQRSDLEGGSSRGHVIRFLETYIRTLHC